jgi:hypothetical protein
LTEGFKMTYLEAINYVITQVGAAPVTDETDTLPDVASSKLRLTEASRWVQKRGWWFNTDLNVQYTPDANDGYRIALPTNLMKILHAAPAFLIERGGFAYNPYTQSTSFEGLSCVTVDVVLENVWDDLPQSAQDCIRIAAAQQHVTIELEDTRKADGLFAIYREALIDMKKDDLEIRKRTMRYNPSAIRTKAGVRPYRSGSRNPLYPGG